MEVNRVTRDGVGILNRIALVVAVLLLAALGAAWWWDRAQRWEEPAFEAARFQCLLPPDPRVESPERWVVAVNLGCGHCQAHLRALATHLATRPSPPALGVLLVDEPARPVLVDLGVPLPAGVWWDRDAVWRTAWGRRAYGETYRFDAAGKLLGRSPADAVPDRPGVRL